MTGDLAIVDARQHFWDPTRNPYPFAAFVADRPAADRRALFHDNAARIYRIAGD